MRLDYYLAQQGFFDSRSKARQAIERNEVHLDGKIVNKPALEINPCKPQNIKIISAMHFVSLGGYKLQKALSDFDFNVKGMIAADLGASTGGFTDCLLQNGVKKVFCVDLNDSLLHPELVKDNRVVTLIKNARELEKSDFGDPLDLITAELSFISATYIIPVISKITDHKKYALILIKPQFETGIKKNFKNGIIKDKKLRISACEKVYECAISNNLIPQKITTTPYRVKKNVEYMMLLQKDGEYSLNLDEYFSK